MSNVGFIGVGYMGYGMAKNLLKKHNVYIFAHKNRKPVNKLIKIGAKELKTYSEIKNIKIDCLMMCVTNTPIAINVANKIKNYLNRNTLIIDLTTNDKNGTLKMNKIFLSKKISYNFCGVMGGPVQSEQGILGGIYGGKKNDFPKLTLFSWNLIKYFL